MWEHLRAARGARPGGKAGPETAVTTMIHRCVGLPLPEEDAVDEQAPRGTLVHDEAGGRRRGHGLGQKGFVLPGRGAQLVGQARHLAQRQRLAAVADAAHQREPRRHADAERCDQWMSLLSLR